MKTTLICLFSIFSIAIAIGQVNLSKSIKELKTSKYQGKYSYGDKPELGAGSVTVYPETDSTVLFWLDICRAGDLNLGQLYARLKIENGQGVYSSTDFGEKCKWKILISNDSLTITTINNQDDCGFGYGVTADNKYRRKSSKRPDFFIDMHNHKIYFNETAPENYER